MKEEGVNLQRNLEHYEEHYVPVSDYEEEIAKRDEIMILMKNKLEQFEAMSEDYLKKEDAMSNRAKETEIIIGNYKQKNHQLEDLNQQLIGKIKSYEQANNIFKISEQKSKDQFSEYERLVKKTKEEYEDLKQSFIKLEQ
jgi:chromosome segregation ATPase